MPRVGPPLRKNSTKNDPILDGRQRNAVDKRKKARKKQTAWPTFKSAFFIQQTPSSDNVKTENHTIYIIRWNFRGVKKKHVGQVAAVYESRKQESKEDTK